MPDISMCTNKHCASRYNCYRYMAVPDEYQSYSVFCEEGPDSWQHFWPLKDHDRTVTIAEMKKQEDKFKMNDVTANQVDEDVDFGTDGPQIHIEPGQVWRHNAHGMLEMVVGYQPGTGYFKMASDKKYQPPAVIKEYTLHRNADGSLA